MLISIKRARGSIILRVKVRDSSVATGAGLTGLTSASAGLLISTIADNEAAATVYSQAAGTIEAITTLGTYAAPTATKCRFAEVDATNHKGVYEIQIADARFAVAGATSLLVSLSGATNMAQCDALVPLTDYAGAPMEAGYPITQNSATYALTIDIGVTGRTLTAQLSKNGAAFAAAAGAVSEIGDGVYAVAGNATDSNALGPLVLAMFDGGALVAKKEFLVVPYAAADLSSIKTKTDQLTFTTTNQVDATTVSMGAAAIASIWNALTTGLTTAGSVGKLLVDNVNAAIGSVAAAVWDLATTGHTTTGTFGAAMNAAGSAGDPWATTLPGAYGAGTAGNIVGTLIDAAISTRLATAGYTAPDNASIAAIKAKTDNLPAAPADETLIIAATTAIQNLIGAPAGVSVSADIAAAKADTAAIKAKTDNLPAAPAAVGSAMTLTPGERDAIATDLLDLANAVDGQTLRGTLRLIGAVLLGTNSGVGTGTETFKAMDGSKTRVTATIDANNNRTAVTKDAA